MTRLKRLLGRLLLLAISLAIGLGLLEVAVRVLLDFPQPLGIRHPLLGRTYRPGREVVIDSRESDERIPLRFNRDGFRGADLPHARDDGTGRIAVIGDSFVAAISVREEQTLVRQLERLMGEARPGTRWEVMNFGVGAASTGQELVLYRELVAKYAPDSVVLAFFIGNDLADNSSAMSSYPRIYFTLDESGELTRQEAAGELAWSRWLNESSRFYVWQKTATRKLKRRLRGKGERFDDGERIFVADPAGDTLAAWRLTEALIRRFADEAAQRGSRLVVALLPPAEQVYDDRWEDLLRRSGELAPRIERDYPHRRLGALCRREGIEWVSLTEPFRAATAGRPAGETPVDELLFFDAAGHFTPRGHRLAAEVLREFLLRNEGAGEGSGAALAHPDLGATTLEADVVHQPIDEVDAAPVTGV